MDIKFQRDSIRMIKRLLDRKTPTEAILPRRVQKPVCGRTENNSPLPRVSPGSQGVSEAYIERFFREIEENGTVFPHSVIIMRNGKIIAEKDFSPYNANYRHVTHSLCKTMTGLAVGMLADDGKLSVDDSIRSFFEDELTPLARMIPPKCTVKHLLTMSSGVVFNELGLATETDWTRAFLESAEKFVPGTEFSYNSMNTYLLSAIVTKITGKKLCDFLYERLFTPLGISEYLWEECPKGINTGGWGLYMRLEDMAKVAQMMLNKGRWNGNVIVSEKWIGESTSVHSIAPESCGDYDYGYQLWVGRKNTDAESSFLLNGMLGQNILCYPSKNMLVAITGGNGSMFQQNAFFRIANGFFGKDYVPSETPLPETKKKTDGGRMLKYARNLRAVRADASKKIPLLEGKTFVFSPNYTASVGVVPLLLQVMGNNYSSGLKSISFLTIDGKFHIVFHENDGDFCVPLGFGAPEYSVIDFHGDRYDIAAEAAFATDEDDRDVLKIRISFIETADVRRIKIFISDGKIHVVFSETPGLDALLEVASLAIGEIRTNKIAEMIFSHADADYLIYRIKNVLEPEFTGVEEKR